MNFPASHCFFQKEFSLFSFSLCETIEFIALKEWRSEFASLISIVFFLTARRSQGPRCWYEYVMDDLVRNFSQRTIYGLSSTTFCKAQNFASGVSCLFYLMENGEQFIARVYCNDAQHRESNGLNMRPMFPHVVCVLCKCCLPFRHRSSLLFNIFSVPNFQNLKQETTLLSSQKT